MKILIEENSPWPYVWGKEYLEIGMAAPVESIGPRALLLAACGERESVIEGRMWSEASRPLVDSDTFKRTLAAVRTGMGSLQPQEKEGAQEFCAYLDATSWNRQVRLYSPQGTPLLYRLAYKIANFFGPLLKIRYVDSSKISSCRDKIDNILNPSVGSPQAREAPLAIESAPQPSEGVNVPSTGGDSATKRVDDAWRDSRDPSFEEKTSTLMTQLTIDTTIDFDSLKGLPGKLHFLRAMILRIAPKNELNLPKSADAKMELVTGRAQIVGSVLTQWFIGRKPDNLTPVEMEKCKVLLAGVVDTLPDEWRGVDLRPKKTELKEGVLNPAP